jgi:osmotically-inducible protein OsmY
MPWKLPLVFDLLAALGACGGGHEPAARAPAPTTVMGAAPAPAPAQPTLQAQAQAQGERVDTRIVTQVKSGLAADPDLGAVVIDVDSKEGLVVLAGVAPSAAARQRASDIARQTPDVKDVSNQLAVKAG